MRVYASARACQREREKGGGGGGANCCRDYVSLMSCRGSSAITGASAKKYILHCTHWDWDHVVVWAK